MNPKVIVVLAGTNNVGPEPGDEDKVADITRGLEAIRDVCRRKAPEGDHRPDRDLPAQRQHGGDAGDRSHQPEPGTVMADGVRVRYLNVNDKLADPQGRLFDGMMHERDKLHPTLKGYQVWADALKPILTELLGPPAATDHAPPPHRRSRAREEASGR